MKYNAFVCLTYLESRKMPLGRSGMPFLSIATIESSMTTKPPAAAQAPLELDRNVKYGKLENGLTYYVMHNEKPAQSIRHNLPFPDGLPRLASRSSRYLIGTKRKYEQRHQSSGYSSRQSHEGRKMSGHLPPSWT